MRCYSQNADLTEANLAYADLREAKLVGVKLGSTKLKYADLRDTFLEGIDISKTMPPFEIVRIEGMWLDVVIMNDYIQIAHHQSHPVSAWEAFSDEEIDSMGEGVLAFWQTHKQKILAIAKIMTM